MLEHRLRLKLRDKMSDPEACGEAQAEQQSRSRVIGFSRAVTGI